MPTFPSRLARSEFWVNPWLTPTQTQTRPLNKHLIYIYVNMQNRNATAAAAAPSGPRRHCRTCCRRRGHRRRRKQKALSPVIRFLSLYLLFLRPSYCVSTAIGVAGGVPIPTLFATGHHCWLYDFRIDDSCFRLAAFWFIVESGMCWLW